MIEDVENQDFFWREKNWETNLRFEFVKIILIPLSNIQTCKKKKIHYI